MMTESAQAFVEDCTVAGIREAEKALQEPGQLERLARYHGDKARWVLEAWPRPWLSPRFAGWTLDAELRRLRCPVLAPAWRPGRIRLAPCIRNGSAAFHPPAARW